MISYFYHVLDDHDYYPYCYRMLEEYYKNVVRKKVDMGVDVNLLGNIY